MAITSITGLIGKSIEGTKGKSGDDISGLPLKHGG